MSTDVNEPVLLLPLPALSVLDLVGSDAAAILHNLTTNEVKSLQVDASGVETFITNLKGKCIAHVVVFRTAEGYRLIGAAGQSEAIATQMDRYTIREDAQPRVIDDRVEPYLLVGPHVGEPLTFRSLDQGDTNLPSYAVPWIDVPEGRRGRLILAESAVGLSPERVADALRASEFVDDAVTLQVVDSPSKAGAEEAFEVFHALRVTAGYPWHGIDFNDSHLPQEINREQQTISFTKGCYLGQETIARLDALGQVQKKLVLWSIDGPGLDTLPDVDTKLFAGGEKPVGRLTSVARTVSNGSIDGRALALGFARRSHFEVGCEASGTVAGKSFLAKVERA